MEMCLIIPRFFLALMIFSLICFLKYKLESSMRAKWFGHSFLPQRYLWMIWTRFLTRKQNLGGLLSRVWVKF